MVWLVGSIGISWLLVVVALAGLAQRRLETTWVADLQGAVGI